MYKEREHIGKIAGWRHTNRPGQIVYDVRNDLRKIKLLKWTEQAQDRHEWKKTVEKAKTLHEL
jgi:hypothetical protein